MVCFIRGQSVLAPLFHFFYKTYRKTCIQPWCTRKLWCTFLFDSPSYRALFSQPFKALLRGKQDASWVENELSAVNRCNFTGLKAQDVRLSSEECDTGTAHNNYRKMVHSLSSGQLGENTV